ncbi:MAG: DUF4166 domain-containing protein [Minwuia sp.]|nr:DUF4166 domain-containing protein [Minwuia sp.]
MKVAIIGGAGVFGSRLAELLMRDGHEVAIAGRAGLRPDMPATLSAATYLVCDRAGDLDALLACEPQLVVDASGPFQEMGDDPWRVAAFCIAHGLHYLDLSDDIAFTAGISALDAAARHAGTVVLSGVSSMPALSSAVVATLREGLANIDLVETAAFPGNRAPRGRSVVRAIMLQVGRPMDLWRGGRWHRVPGWSHPKAYELEPGMQRTGWLIPVPDLLLFPMWTGARSVLFRAGMELPVLNLGLAIFGWFRRTRLVPHVPEWLVSLTIRGAKAVGTFGTDRGGMVVKVTGRANDVAVARSWTLIAEDGDGPYIPTIPARTMIGMLSALSPGARPCLAECSIADMEARMSDLNISFKGQEDQVPCLFQDVLGTAWQDLPEAVRDIHRIGELRVFAGTASVTRGEGFLAGLAAGIIGFPPEARDTPVSVTISRAGHGETWQRNFGGRMFRSRLRAAGPGQVWECFGPFCFLVALTVRDGELGFPVTRGRFFGIPMPRMLLPRSEAREFAHAGAFQFDVALYLPLTGQLMVRYRGWLKAVAAEP